MHDLDVNTTLLKKKLYIYFSSTGVVRMMGLFFISACQAHIDFFSELFFQD